MKTTSTTLVCMALLAGAISLGSCKKKEPDPPPPQDTEQSTAADNNVAEIVASDIESIGSQASGSSSLETYRESAPALEMAACANVSVNTTAKVITVDFGSGCLGADGQFRSGKLTFDFSSSINNAMYYRNPGFRMVVTAQNYVVSGHSVTINNKVVENTTPVSIGTGTNPGTNLTWSVTADISIAKPGGAGIITWKCNRVKTLVNTSDPDCYRGQSLHIIWQKAVVSINGSASGTNAKGEGYTVQANNLKRDFTCAPYAQRPHWHPFIEGTLVYTPGTRPARTIDYGNGSCDANAVISINGVSYAFTLL